MNIRMEKMKKKLTLLGLAVLVSGNLANAVVFMNLTPSTTTLAPGDDFTLTLSLSTDTEKVSGVSYQLAVNAAGAGEFYLSARDTSAAQLTYWTTDNSELLKPAAAQLAPYNAKDIGATASDLENLPGPGTISLCTLTVSSLATVAPGTYTFSLYNFAAFDESFSEYAVSYAPFTMTVTAVPEPGCLALLLLATSMLLRRCRRQNA